MAVKTFSKARDGQKYLSAHFQIWEFACNDGSDKILIDVDFVKNYLEKIRVHFGLPMVITSNYRTQSWNAYIKGSSTSFHLYGRAFDFYIPGISVSKIAAYAETIGVKGIGCYYKQKFVHCDSRTIKSFWKETIFGNMIYGLSTHGGTAPTEDNMSIVKRKVKHIDLGEFVAELDYTNNTHSGTLRDIINQFTNYKTGWDKNTNTILISYKDGYVPVNQKELDALTAKLAACQTTLAALEKENAERAEDTILLDKVRDVVSRLIERIK